MDDEVFALLARYGAALCIHDLIERHPWVMTAGWAYLRFHGPDALSQKYWGRYGGRRLSPVARRIRECLDDGRDVYAYFNNDYEGNAVRDAQWLASKLVPAAAQR